MNIQIRSLKSQGPAYSSRKSEFSDFMSIRSQKFNYAIQSIPNKIQHKKTAFKDYFEQDQDPQIEDEERIDIKINQTWSQMSRISNPYAEDNKNKYLLPSILKDKLKKILLQTFTVLKKSNLITSTARKIPTFRASSYINKNQQFSIISQKGRQIPENLIGTISKQSRKSIQMSQSKRKIVVNQQLHEIQYFKPNIILLNKLLFVEGANLLQNYGQNSNKNQQFQTRSQSKAFSLLNSQRKTFSILNEL